MIFFRYSCIVILCLYLSACSSQENRPETLIPVEERYVPAEDKTELPAYSGDKVQPTVIASLIEDSNQHAAAGNTDKAIALLERALRIEPGNALLWHQFAQVRLQQSNWQQAIALARKSNALAGNDQVLKSRNWAVIASAYEKLGDPEKAKEARRQQRLSG